MRPLLFLLICAPILASTVPSPIDFFNFQSTAFVLLNDGYGMFGGFEFSTAYMWDDASGTKITLPLGGTSYLRSNPNVQSISAQASVEFSDPGYRVIAVELSGTAVDDGTSAGESFGISQPCSLSVSGSASYGNKSCQLVQGGLVSGRITAWMNMYSDSRTFRSDMGQISSPAITLTVIHNPEPVTMLLIATGLIGIGLMGRKGKT